MATSHQTSAPLQQATWPNRDTLFVDDNAFQAYLLQGVSRTFALTIPQLPSSLCRAVSNAYLLCRTVDTIEDEPALDLVSKEHFCHQYVAALKGQLASEAFAAELAPRLSDRTLPLEILLVRSTPRILTITRSLNPVQQEALVTCVEGMARGMVEFQGVAGLAGLKDLAHLDRYCYFVAGIVGEMLTRLFCDYSPAIARHHSRLMPLAVSFGQGLQMTNILKDIWEDRARGVCWLPRTVFPGLTGGELTPGRPGFEPGLETLLGIAHGHLCNALEYTLLIPPRERGIRSFCLWAIAMALLTLRKINARRDFSSGHQVKITRHSVRATAVVGRLTVEQDWLLHRLFEQLARPLPSPPPEVLRPCS
ncbi:MAG: phytoene/squalene synthase family protein [Candidatus Competibacteraceae bacterium]|nr:phytoene/squalene synthase family protein [Candidatus Competibacteraceae bacterium]